MASLVAWSSWARRASCCCRAWPCWSTWPCVAWAFWSTTATCWFTYFSVAQAPRLSAPAARTRATAEDLSLFIMALPRVPLPKLIRDHKAGRSWADRRRWQGHGPPQRLRRPGVGPRPDDRRGGGGRDTRRG